MMRLLSLKGWVGVALALVLLVGGLVGGYLRLTDPARRADRLEAAGDVRGALLDWRNAATRSPRDPEVHLRLGTAQLKAAESVAAERSFRQARSTGANRDVVTVKLAEAMIAQGKYIPLLLELPQTVAPPELSAKLMLLRAMAELATNNMRGADTILAAARKEVPDRVEVPLIAARIAVARSKAAEAEAAVDAALRINPEQIDALQMRTQLLAARGDATGALAAAERAMQVAPWSAGVRLDRAAQLIVAGEDDEAREDVDYVLYNYPRVAAARYYHAVLLARARRFADAAPVLDSLAPVIERFPRALLIRGIIEAGLGNMATALDFATRYNRRDPADADGVRLLAQTQLAQNDPAAALLLLQRAVKAGQADAETLDLLGQAYAAAGDKPAALAAFRKAASLSGTAATLTRLGAAEMESGDVQAGMAALSRAAGLAPNDGSTQAALIEATLRAGEPAKAAAMLQTLRARDGLTEAAAVLDGTIELADSDYDGARAAYAAAMAAFPDSVPARIGLGKALILLGRVPEGVARLGEALAMRPGDIGTLTVFLQFAVRDGNYRPVIPALEAAQRAAPDNERILAILADALVRAEQPKRAIDLLLARRGTGTLPPLLLGALARAQEAAGQAPGALATYREQVRLTPGDGLARRAQVLLLLRENNLVGARQALAEALAQQPGVLSVMAAAVDVQRRIGGLDAAVALARTLRADSAQMPGAALLEGIVLMEAKEYARARDAFAAEFAAAPSSALAQRLALAWLAMGEPARAVEPLDGWLAGHPDDAGAAQVLARLDLLAGRLDAAAVHLETVLKSRPDNVVALNNLAWVLQQRGDPRALALAQRAYLEEPNGSTADTLGWILVQRGSAKAAVPVLRRAGGTPEHGYHLAVALKDAGEPAEAGLVLDEVLARPDPFPSRAAAAALRDTVRGAR